MAVGGALGLGFIVVHGPYSWQAYVVGLIVGLFSGVVSAGWQSLFGGLLGKNGPSASEIQLALTEIQKVVARIESHTKSRGESVSHQWGTAAIGTGQNHDRRNHG